VRQALRVAWWGTVAGIGALVIGLAVFFVYALSEVLANPGLSLVDGYWIGRLPWTGIGEGFTVIGATVAVVLGTVTVWIGRKSVGSSNRACAARGGRLLLVRRDGTVSRWSAVQRLRGASSGPIRLCLFAASLDGDLPFSSGGSGCRPGLHGAAGPWPADGSAALRVGSQLPPPHTMLTSCVDLASPAARLLTPDQFQQPIGGDSVSGKYRSSEAVG
jgi:hypothetical protein